MIICRQYALDYLAGYFCGDGSACKAQMRFYGHGEDKVRVGKMLEVLSLPFEPFPNNKKCPEAWCWTWPQALRPLLMSTGVDLVGSSLTRRLPVDLLTGQPGRIKPWVEGMWDADGCVSTTERVRLSGRVNLAKKVTYTTYSTGMATDLGYLLTELGMTPNIHTGVNNRGERYNTVTINSPDYGLFKASFLLQDSKQQRLNQIV